MTMQATDRSELDMAIESLYETFSRYPRPDVIEYCPCGCTKENATAHLVAVSLRELSFADLEGFCHSALTTQGSLDDLRYLLPRMLQGISEDLIGCCPEILFGKLSYGEWLTWPEDEVLAVKRYMQALWSYGLVDFPLERRLPAFAEIESLLASFAVTGEDLVQYLEKWSENKSVQADKHLIQFVTMFGKEFSGGRTLSEAFWEDSKPQAEALRRWLLHADTMERILNAAHLLRVDGYEYLFEPAVAILLGESGSTSKRT